VTPATTTGFSALAQVGPQIIGGTGDGFILRYDGMMVARYDTLIPNPSEGIWSRRPDDTWLATNVEVWHYDGIGWTNTLAATSQRLKGVYGTAADDVWTWANDGSVYHFDGATWAVQPSLHFAGSAMWGVSPTDLWFFGITAMHFDGTMALDTFIPPATFNCASGTGSADIWAATQAAAAEIYHWDGVGWTLAYTAPSGIRALAAVAPGEVFAFGNDRRVYQLSGNVWHTTLLPAIGLLVAGAATAPDDVFAATPTEIFHFDGARWSPVRAPNDPQLASDPIAHIDAHPGYVDFLYFDNTGSNQVRRLVRTRPWDCAVTETVCGDGVDNDCDGLVDGNDPDCP
jgi:hypothetical protein